MPKEKNFAFIDGQNLNLSLQKKLEYKGKKKSTA